MSRLETLSYWRGDHLPATWGPASDLIVLDLTHMPGRPNVARWAASAQVPTIVAARQPEQGMRRTDVYDGHGHWVGAQCQTHRIPGDADPPLLADDLHVFDLGGHPVGIVVGEDILVPEVSRALGMMGVELLLTAAAPRLPEYLGVWRESQQNQVLGWAGGSAPLLTAPCEVHPEATGFIPPEALSGWFRASLPWGPLAAVREASLLQTLNPSAYLRSPWWAR